VAHNNTINGRLKSNSGRSKDYKQIKKGSACYTPACEWQTVILSQAYVPQPDPIIHSVTGLEASAYDPERPLPKNFRLGKNKQMVRRDYR